MTLDKEFGFCIIPKGSILFHGHEQVLNKDCMFFGTKYWVARAFNSNVQVWKAKKNIKVLFLVEHLDARSKAKSSIPQLYKKLFPNEADKDYNDLDIKQNVSIRNKFIRELSSRYNINGWLTSVEGYVELEICLFNETKNSNNIEFLEIYQDSNSDRYAEDTLKYIDIFPSSSFYVKTKKIFSKHYRQEKSSYFESYRDMIKDYISEEVREGGYSEKERINFYHNLRIRLKL